MARRLSPKSFVSKKLWQVLGQDQQNGTMIVESLLRIHEFCTRWKVERSQRDLLRTASSTETSQERRGVHSENAKPIHQGSSNGAGIRNPC